MYQSASNPHPDDFVAACPADTTREERATARDIRMYVDSTFTVEQLRRSRQRALDDALRTASALEAAGLTLEASVYRGLSAQLVVPDQLDR